MFYSFNDYGWYAGALPFASGNARVTSAEPPTTGATPVIGQPWPNWSGIEWVMAPYRAAPVPDPKIAQRAEILRQLAELDAQSDSPRARREAALGDTSYLQTLNDQAAVLRQELHDL